MIANISTRLFILTSLSLLLSFGAHAQNSANGNIEVNDTVKLEVIRVFPDSFPNVAVIFRASGPNGQALNKLDTSNVHVTEDGQQCNVVSVRRISKDWAVNTALVVDHSGSMRMDNVLRKHWDSLPASAWHNEMHTMREHTQGEVDSDSLIAVRVAPADPAWYHTPLWYAQQAAKSYMYGSDDTKDQTSLVGFSTDVDVTMPLTGDQSNLSWRIDNLRPSGETAFYDAVSVAIDQADKGDGIRVVIAMTDGKDNNSRESLNGVILKAKAKKIPVYVIGLGDVDQSPLKLLARETGGLSYFTNDASTLSDIYKRITLEIQSIYEVIYESPSMSMNDTTRTCQLYFDVDSKYLSSRSLSFVLPKEVVARINAKEEQIAAQALPVEVTEPASGPEIPWGLVGIGVTVLAAGVLSARYMNRNKKKTRLEIVNIYPNPTSGPLTIDLNKESGLSGSTLIIRNTTGSEVMRSPLGAGLSHSIDVSSLENGSYSITIASGADVSFTKTLIVAK
jgi:Ca-activated chloride channel family protein